MSVAMEPANLEAERAVLSALLIDRDAIISVAPQLEPDDFYDRQHAAIYAAMLALYRQRVPVDFVTLHDELARPGYAYSGGAAALAQLATEQITAVHAPYYAERVRSGGLRRRYIRALEESLQAAFDPALDLEQLEVAVDRALLGARQGNRGSDYLALSEAVTLAMDALDSDKRHERMIFSGYLALDQKIGGFEPGQLVTIAGRPGTGKTAAAVQLAYAHGVVKRRPLGFLSLEMSETAIVGRLLAIRSHLNIHAVRGTRPQDRPDEVQQKLTDAAGYVSNGAVQIIRRRSADIAVLTAQARDMHARFGIECLIVDYLQLMSAGRSENRTQEVSAVSRGLKLLAMDLEIPVIALAQLNREVERRGGDAIPRLSDLRDSGAIEQDSDIVVFLHRDTQAQVNEVQEAEFIVAKHREGPTGVIPMLWRAETEQYLDRAGAAW